MKKMTKAEKRQALREDLRELGYNIVAMVIMFTVLHFTMTCCLGVANAATRVAQGRSGAVSESTITILTKECTLNEEGDAMYIIVGMDSDGYKVKYLVSQEFFTSHETGEVLDMSAKTNTDEK